MAMNVGGGGDKKSVTPNMNVTPLVDVVLVLLIIFIVITPQLTKKFWVHTPKQEKKEIEQQDLTQDPSPPLVLRVANDKTINVNSSAVPLEELPDRLRRMFAARPDARLLMPRTRLSMASLWWSWTRRAGGAITIAPLIAKLEPAPTRLPARRSEASRSMTAGQGGHASEAFEEVAVLWPTAY
jgi:biopolymer transport protein ExbD